MKFDTITFEYTPLLFTKSQCKEINSLFKKGVFKFIDIINVLEGIRIFNSRFVNKIKNTKTNKAFKKSRLII